MSQIETDHPTIVKTNILREMHVVSTIILIKIKAVYIVLLTIKGHGFRVGAATHLRSWVSFLSDIFHYIQHATLILLYRQKGFVQYDKTYIILLLKLSVVLESQLTLKRQ